MVGSASADMRHFWVDRIVEFEAGVRAIGVKSVSLSEDVFDDHFPGNPVFPGVFLLEGLAQTGGMLLAKTYHGERLAIMVSIERARFRSFARPGDSVRMEVEIENTHDDFARVLGTATVGARQVAAARFSFKLVHPSRIIPPAYRDFWEQSRSTWFGEYLDIDGE